MCTGLKLTLLFLPIWWYFEKNAQMVFIFDSHAEPDSNDDTVLKKAWEKCETESNSVEVVYKNSNEKEILTKVYFQFSPKV